jgi:hypothetical protein
MTTNHRRNRRSDYKRKVGYNDYKVFGTFERSRRKQGRKMTFDYNDYKATTKDFGVCSQRKSSVQAGFRVLTTMTTIFFLGRSEREENKACARIRVSLDFFA